MSRLRITLCTHLFPSEVTELSGPWLAEQADALAAHADVSVLACLRRCRNRDETRASGVRVFYRQTALMPGTGRLALLAAAVRYRAIAGRLLERLDPPPHVLHAHFGFPDAVVVASLARKLGLPWVATLHGDDAFFLLRRRDPLGALIRGALHQASAVVCVSPAMGEAVREVLGTNTRVEIIENGFDDSLFAPGEGPVSARPGGVLFAGTLTPVKNVDVLLHAYASLVDPPPLTIVGDGPLRTALKHLAAQLEIDARVRFLGVRGREEVARLMREARVLVIPSASEGYGMVAAEALACGTPVVASNVGGLPRIVTSAEAGALVAPGDSEALRDEIECILTAEWDPKAVAAASGARPWREPARELQALYEDVLNRS